MWVNIVFLNYSRKLIGNYYFNELLFTFPVANISQQSGFKFEFSFHYPSVVISLGYTNTEQHAKQLKAEVARSKLNPSPVHWLVQELSLLKQLHIPPPKMAFLPLSSFCPFFLLTFPCLNKDIF